MQPRQSLTKCFHVVVKVLAVDQFPGGTEGVGHGGGSSQSNLRIALSRAAASSATFPPVCYYSAPYHCAWRWAVPVLPIGSGDPL